MDGTVKCHILVTTFTKNANLMRIFRMKIEAFILGFSFAICCLDV